MTVSTYYFDASVSGPTDTSSAWTNPDRAFNGLTGSSYARASSVGGSLIARGTTAPESNTGVIVSVRARVYEFAADENAIIRASNGTFTAGVIPYEAALGWGSWVTLTQPTSGWTWTQLANLEVELQHNAGSVDDIYRVEIEVTHYADTANSPNIETWTAADSAGATVTSLIIPAPSGIQADDLLVAFGGSDADNEAGAVLSTTETGWTKLGEEGDDTSDCHVAVWYKVAAGSEGSFTFDSSASDELIGWYLRISGADTTTPIETSGGNSGTIVDISQFSRSVAPFHNSGSTGQVSEGDLLVSVLVTDGSDMFPPGTTTIATYTGVNSVIWIDSLQPEAGGNDVGGHLAATDDYTNGFDSQSAEWRFAELQDTGQGIDGYASIGLSIMPAAASASETDADATGSATTSFNSEALKKTDGSATGSATTSFQAGGIIESVGSSTCSSTTVGYSAVVREAVGAIVAATVVDGQASFIAVAIGTAAGSATVNGLASSRIEATFDISGQATVTGLSVQGETAFAASSSATAQFDAATIDSGVANVSGISSIIFAVNATNTSTAASDGLTTTNVQTAIVSQADASTLASATVVGNSAAIGAAVGTIASTSSITFITTSDAQATATSSGSTTINVTTVAIWNEIATATAQATTSADSGSINLTIASATGLSTVTGLSTATYEFEAFRFRNDNGTEITATWKAVQDANISLNTNVIVRLRTLIDSTGDADPAQVTLQYRKVGEAENDWRNV